MKAFLTLHQLFGGLKYSWSYFVGALFQKRTYQHLAYDKTFPWHNKKQRVTQRYPAEQLPLPDHARYKLHNEMDDCIVCDKCAKVCPVDCIDIVPIPSVQQPVGTSSIGKPIRLHAEKFDIDMAKCCYCGLCTVVCPTQCLTMTKEYDFSTEDVGEHIFSFATLSPQEAVQKKKEWEAYKQSSAKTSSNSS